MSTMKRSDMMVGFFSFLQPLYELHDINMFSVTCILLEKYLLGVCYSNASFILNIH